ncbi:MAG: tRNA lysidine(34) synthetase TilS [Flavobacteriaceae bacterium]|nr:tRNA lysidine(34) synthetase TilS [Flavobacteriaceae bacterium]
MLSLFQKHTLNNLPFLQGKKLLIATSGGIDSVVLTHLLHKLQFSISLAHCNFRLRGKDSNLDEVFVQKEAIHIDASFFVKHFETELYANKKDMSIQMAARELRYQWFNELMQKNNFDYLITAHHADDNLETFLINFIRGTGLDGLTGIPVINDKIIRPLLPFTRKEIESYANKNNLVWREDKSNAETKYLRNKLRHDIIPILKELNPNFMTSFANTIENLQGSQQIINDKIDTICQEIIEQKENIKKFNINKINKLSNPKPYLFELLKEYGFTQWNDIKDLLNAQSGKQVFSKTHRLLKDRTFLLLSEITLNFETKKISIDENTNKFSNDDFQLNFKTIQSNSLENTLNNITCVDKDLLNFPLVVRKWEKGDYFYPIGMQGKKKLSKFFKDEKYSLLEKEKTWLLCTVQNEIIWIIEKRLDNRFKITDKTTQIFKIEIKNINK